MAYRRWQLVLVGVLASCGGPASTAAPPGTLGRTAPPSGVMHEPPAGQAAGAPTEPPSATPAPPAPLPSPAVVVKVPADSITATVQPATAFLERTDSGVLLNCDLAVRNTSQAKFLLVEIEASVYDRSGALVLRKFVSGNGVSPSIGTVVGRELDPAQQRLILNPLHTFPGDLDLARVVFQLTYDRIDGDQQLVTRAEVAPREFTGKARLVLPLRDRVIAWDGHDYLAHHRRWDYLDPRIQELGFESNAGRYSYDLIMVDASGAMHNGDPARNESWFGFGHPVMAPAAGIVVGVVSDRPDDRQFDLAAVKADLLVVYGNHVLIEHAPGEVSMLAHLRQGSVKVKLGDHVRAGQEIAAVGASGSALMPHLHYQLQTTATGHAEGLPSYFHDFVRVRGARRVPVVSGHIDTGEIVAPGSWR